MHFDNVFFLLLLGVAALFKWLTQKAQESREKPDAGKEEGTDQSNETNLPPAPTGSEEERIRRFLEALGQPSSSPPPRKIIPRPAAPPKRAVLPHVGPSASPLPPLVTQPLPVFEAMPPVAATLPRPLPTPTTTRASTPVETPVFEIRSGQFSAPSRDPIAAFPPTSAPASLGPLLTTSSVLALLTSQDGLRQAVILREIFGPPRSLQELS